MDWLKIAIGYTHVIYICFFGVTVSLFALL